MAELQKNNSIIAVALDHLTASTAEMQRLSVLLVDAEKRLAEHEFRMGTRDDPGHIKLGEGFERADDGTLNFIGKTHFDNVVAEHNAAFDSHPDIRADLAEAKEPKPHAATHAAGGADPISPETLGLNTSVEAVPGTIPVRDTEGKVRGNISGNANNANYA